MSFSTPSTSRRCSRRTMAPSPVSRNLLCSASRPACTPAFRRASAEPLSASAAGGDNIESTPWRRGSAGRKRQDLEAGLGDQHGVLPLCRQAMVLGDDGPAVGELADRRLACVDHRFDRKGHSGLETRPGSGAPIVQHLRLFVEFTPDSMAAELAHHAVPVAFGMLLDCRADVTEKGAGPHHPDAEPHALVGGLAQPLCLYGRFCDVVHAAGIAVKTVFDHRNVDIQDVARLEHAFPRNSVSDLVVDRGADRLREGLVAGRGVVQRGRDRLLLIDDQVMAKTVELAGRDPGLDMGGDEVEHFPGEFPGNAHALDLLRSLQMYRHAFSKKSAKDKTSTPWGQTAGGRSRRSWS